MREASGPHREIAAKFYLLRTFGDSAHEIWDVDRPGQAGAASTDRSASRARTRAGGNATPASRISSRASTGWRTRRMTRGLRPVRSAQLRASSATSAAWCSSGGQRRPTRRCDLHGPDLRPGAQRQPRLFRLRRKQGRRRADRRPGEAAVRSVRSRRWRTCATREIGRLDAAAATSARTRRFPCSAMATSHEFAQR